MADEVETPPETDPEEAIMGKLKSLIASELDAFAERQKPPARTTKSTSILGWLDSLADRP